MTLIERKNHDNETWNNYLKYREELYEVLLPENVSSSLISEANWIVRSRCNSGEEIGIHVRPGDICYMDYGQSYLNEMGFQHFGLVMSVCQKKALVVPMTSNARTYRKAYDPAMNPGGKKNLMRIGRIEGLTKASVLFLNDARFINTARVIDVKAHIPVKGELFPEIQHRLFTILFLNNTEEEA